MKSKKFYFSTTEELLANTAIRLGNNATMAESLSDEETDTIKRGSLNSEYNFYEVTFKKIKRARLGAKLFEVKETK